MTLRSALLAATVLALPLAATAQPIDGLYIAGGVGVNAMGNTKITAEGSSLSLRAPKVGIDGFASVGYGYGNGFRAELELLGISNNAHFGSSPRVGGNNNVLGGMVNGLYDFTTDLGFSPYLGLGVGYVGVQEIGYSAFGESLKSGYLGSFAAQAIVGASVPVAPNLALTVDYRALDKTQNRYVGTNFGSNARFGEQLNQSINVGLRYTFGAAPVAAAPAPAPAAVVAPAPAPARSYLVFFDWDKADLTARAQQIIADAAKNASRVASTRIEVAGHADKSGTAAYNQSLSLARANNVAAELVRLGVAKSAISISAFGDTKPLVPTAAGVREPQNRRVEIVLK